MTRPVRYTLYGVGAAVLLAIILIAAAIITLRSAWFRDKVRARIVYEIENATGGRAQIGAFDLNWSTLTASVRGLVIHGTEGPGQAQLFRADLVKVGLKIISIWKKKVDLESLVVLRPQVNVIIYPDGRTNFPKPRAARKRGKGTVQTILDLAVRHFNLSGGTVQFQMRRTPLDVVGENLRALVLYEAGPPRYRGDIGFQKLDITPGQMKTMPFDVAGKFVLERDRVDITAARFSLGESSVDVKGSVVDFAAPRANLDYAAHIFLKDVPPPFRIASIPNRGAIVLGGQASLSGASRFAVSGRLKASGLEFEERGIRVHGIAVTSAVSVTPDRVDFNDISATALRGRVTGRAEIVNFREFRVDVDVSGFSLEDLTHLQGVRHVDWNGTMSGPVRIAGEFRRGLPADVTVAARMSIAPAAGPNPVEGLIDMTYRRRGGLLSFAPSHLETHYTRADFSGVLGRALNVKAATSDLNDVEPAIAMFSSGPPAPLPIALDRGTGNFQGTISGPLNNPAIQGHAVATNLVWEKRKFDRAEADINVTRNGVAARNATVQLGRIRGSGAVQVGLRGWKAPPEEPFTGSFTAQAPNAADAIAALGAAPLDVASGPATASGTLSGTLGTFQIAAHAQALKVVAWNQPVDRVEGDVRYTDTLLEVPAAHLEIGRSAVEVSGSYQHPKNDWKQGRARFQIQSAEVALASLTEVQELAPGLEGALEPRLAGEIVITQSGFRPGAINGAVAVRDLSFSGERLGSLALNASTKGDVLAASIKGDLAGSAVTGSSDFTLRDDYPARGSISFTPMRFSTLAARFVRPKPGEGQPPFEGIVEGRMDFSGSTLDAKSWRASLQLPVLEIHPSTTLVELPNPQDFTVRNTGPVLLDLDSRGVRVRQAVFRGKDTNLMVTGDVGFGVRNPWNLRVRGALNLTLLRDFERNVYSSGALALDVSVRGALARPDIYGRLDLKNGSVNFTDFPNGIDNANGIIFLYRDRATIDSFTAESGGGKINVSGFVGFAAIPTFHLTAQATDVRVRYPEGVSSTMNANLGYTGTLDRSVLSGDVTITRVGFNPRSDLGSILAATAQPVRAPARPNKFEQGLRFDIRIVTSPQVQFETKLTRDVQAEANLRLRGDPIRPILLGRIIINQGEVIFFGNQYTIDSGQILFVNAAKIEPQVNLDLETRARGVDITFHVSGPVDKLNVSYRSDPPMPSADIIALLATGRTPSASTTPGLSGTAQQQLSQSWEQAGASALLSQAIANPIAGRLQRFFGVSRLKIDPSITGLTTTNAAARITLEQNITQNLTLTFVTDLSRPQAQAIRLEWDFTRNWSGVALREENGLFGIDFLYKKQFK